jgi:hypothetical protein
MNRYQIQKQHWYHFLLAGCNTRIYCGFLVLLVAQSKLTCWVLMDISDPPFVGEPTAHPGNKLQKSCSQQPPQKYSPAARIRSKATPQKLTKPQLDGAKEG